MNLFYVILICAALHSTGVPLRKLRKRQKILQDAALAESTQASRRCQIACYERFCQSYRFKPYPCSPDQARLYATFLSNYMAPSSISNYLSALWNRHHLLGLPSHASDYRLLQTLRGILRLGRPAGLQRYPLSLLDLHSMFFEINTLLPLDLAFWSAVTLAFRGLLRKSHYTLSRHTLVWRDVSLYPDHLVIRINTSKTDQFGTRNHRVLLNASPGSPLCPVFWLGELARVQNPKELDYLIRVPSPHGLAPVSCRWFNFKLKILARRIGLDPTKVSSHSLRHGGASFMSAQGSNLMDIRARGGWASSAIFRYLHHSDATLLKQDLLVSSSV